MNRRKRIIFKLGKKIFQQYLDNKLVTAEKSFGDRTNFYPIYVRLTNEEKPYTVIPKGKNIPKRRKKIVIYTTQVNRGPDLVFELAHELIHALCSSKTTSNVLEEGLATYFSFTTNGLPINSSFNQQSPTYYSAYLNVRQLLGYGNNIIKDIRQQQPMLSEVTNPNILSVNPTIPQTLINNLTQKF